MTDPTTDHDHDPLWQALEARGLTRPKYPDPNRPRPTGPALNDDAGLAAIALGGSPGPLEASLRAKLLPSAPAAPDPLDRFEGRLSEALTAEREAMAARVPEPEPAPRRTSGGGGARRDPGADDTPPALRPFLGLDDPLAEQLRRALDLPRSAFR